MQSQLNLGENVNMFLEFLSNWYIYNFVGTEMTHLCEKSSNPLSSDSKLMNYF